MKDPSESKKLLNEPTKSEESPNDGGEENNTNVAPTNGTGNKPTNSNGNMESISNTEGDKEPGSNNSALVSNISSNGNYKAEAPAGVSRSSSEESCSSSSLTRTRKKALPSLLFQETSDHSNSNSPQQPHLSASPNFVNDDDELVIDVSPTSPKSTGHHPLQEVEEGLIKLVASAINLETIKEGEVLEIPDEPITTASPSILPKNRSKVFDFYMVSTRLQRIIEIRTQYLLKANGIYLILPIIFIHLQCWVF